MRMYKCPFCKSKNVDYHVDLSGPPWTSYVQCDDCLARGPARPGATTQDAICLAIHDWNFPEWP